VSTRPLNRTYILLSIPRYGQPLQMEMIIAALTERVPSWRLKWTRILILWIRRMRQWQTGRPVEKLSNFPPRQIARDLHDSSAITKKFFFFTIT